MITFEGLILTLYLFIIPLFNKSLDIVESLFFFCIPIIIGFVFLINHKDKILISKKSLLLQTIFIILLLISVFFSRDIGSSYYSFFQIICIILITNISIKIIDKKTFINYLIIFSFIYSSIFLLDKIGILDLQDKTLGDNFIKQYWGHSYMADFLIISIPLLIYKKVNPILIVLQIFILILTNSRSSILAAIIITFFINTQKNFHKYFYIALFGITFFYFTVMSIQNRLPGKDVIGSRFDYWQQAFIGFTKHPIVGNGLNTFNIVSTQEKTDNVQSAYAHNISLGILAENGLFTYIFILYILFIQIQKQYVNNRLFFVLFLGLLINSFFDPVFNSPGIAAIGAYLLFKDSGDKKEEKNNVSKILSYIFLSLIIFLITAHTLLKGVSEYYAISNKDYNTSVKIDPFNINSQLKLIEKNKIINNVQSKIFKDNEKIYEKLIESTSLPENESTYYRIFELNPKGHCNLYINLSKYYLQNNKYDKLENILSTMDKNIDPNNTQSPCFIPVSKIHYNLSTKYLNSDQNLSIKHLERSIYYFPKLSHYHVELANLLFQKGDVSKANEVLNNCVTVESAQEHCQDVITKGIFNKPGQEEVIKYINEYIKD